jgi:hypothetical protein
MAMDITAAAEDFAIQSGKVSLASRPESVAAAGKSLPIEILISEIPGGLFCASLLIQELGKNDRAASLGPSFLPLFQLDGSQPEATRSPNVTPYEVEGPVWKFTAVGGGNVFLKSAPDPESPNPFSTLNPLVVNFSNVPSA